MTDLTPDEQLKIANNGGQFEETGEHSWVGTKIRKGKMLGKVIRDTNGAYRTLTVKFDDGSEEDITMNNIGPDPEYVHAYEWLEKNRKVWYKF